MRLSHCESYCGPPLCYIPCIPKSKDAASDAVTAAPAAAAVEEKPPPVQKIEEAVAEKDDDESKEVDGDEEEKTAVAAAPPPAPLKSNLKKGDCADNNCAEKGNVKWLDLLGKDLTEVKEFEPSESGDSMDEDDIAECVCAIQ